MRGRGGFTSWHLVALLAIVWSAGVAAYLVATQTPVGAVTGQVLAEDTGVLLPGAHVYLLPQFSAEGQWARTVELRTREDGSFGPRPVAAGRYRLSAYAKAHKLPETTISIDEGETRALSLELARQPSRLSVYVHQHAWTPDEPVSVICDGLLEDDALAVSVYAVDLTELLRTAGGYLGDWVATAERRFPEGVAASDRFGPVKSLTVPITGRDVEGVFQQKLELPLADPGLYLLVISGDGIARKDWVLVTELGLITKQSGERIVAYAADIASGEPLPDTQLTVYRGAAVVAEGATGPQGLAELRLPATRESDSVLVLAQHEESVAAVHSWYSAPEARPFVAYTYTDRPVYRPGQLVHFKGILRRVVGDGYSVPADEPVLVRIHDDRSTLLYREELRTNDYGSFNGDLKLATSAGPGRYGLTATVRGQHYESGFEVAEYRKPQYKVTVKSDEPRYVRGDPAHVTVDAQYYFGAPVAAAEVAYFVYRAPYWFIPDSQEPWDAADYEDEGYGGYGEIVDSGAAETDEEGRAAITIPTRVAADEELEHDWRYTVEVSVTDPGREAVTATGQFVVTRGEFVLAVTPDRWNVPPGQQVGVQVRAVDYEDRPRPDAQVEVTLERQRWDEEEVESEVEARERVRTDANGEATVALTPSDAGSYVIRAEARDTRGNRIVSRQYLWVTSETYAEFAYEYPELEIITDKKAYEVGETVRALVNTEVEGATALVSIEGPELREWRLTRLEGKSTLLELPVRPEYIPNVYLTVSFVLSKEFVSRSEQLQVSPKPRTLSVQLTPSKSEYGPGEPATYDITTLDSRGRPVPAEVSLGVVDESIYAVREESAVNIVDAFYARRPNRVETSYSFPRIYLGSGDKAGPGQAVRKRFPDTAVWRPTVRTNDQGKARVAFDIPDTLTTWRATARACSLDTLVGSAVNRVVCKKDFLVRLEMPRFLVQGDEAALAAVVHNQTDGGVQVTAALETPGLEVKRTPAVGFSLGSGRTHRLDWWVNAITLGAQDLVLSAQTQSGLSDALQSTLPIIPYGRERVEWRAGAVRSAAREKLFVRQDVVPGTPQMTILLSPSITSSIWDALDYLAQYPWGCTEQTMSAFLPDVIIARALKDVGAKLPQLERLERELPDMVQAGLLKLYGYQHDDGGWGWWRYDESDPWMTAYVVFGLVNAQQAGFPINRYILGHGLNRLADLATSERTGSHARAFAAYVLALAGRTDVAPRALAMLEPRSHGLSAADHAFLTLAYLALGDQPDAEQRYIRLWQAARESDALCHWAGGDGYGHWLSDTEATGLALKASLQVRPEDPRLLKVVRWLMAQREGSHWVSTRDTAFILYAVADFVRTSGELAPDFSLTVSLNGERVGSPLRFSQPSVLAPQQPIEIGPERLRPGDNVLELEKTGTGNLYYSVRLSQYVGQEGLPETITGSGLRVERNYYRLTLRRVPREEAAPGGYAEYGPPEPTTPVLRWVPDEKPAGRVRTGDLLRVKLSISAARDLEYVMLEDPLPAGCEVLDRGDLYEWEWNRWYSDMDIRDQLIAFFARRLPAGRRTIEYDLRCEVPGRFHALPAQAYGMYRPDVRGSGPEAVIEVTE